MDAGRGREHRAAGLLPPAEMLVLGLRAVLASTTEPHDLEMVDRRPNDYASSCASELVTVRRHTEVLQLFCKCGIETPRDPWTHRRGLLHEARAYRELLEPLGVTVPKVHGAWQPPGSETTCLVLDALPSALPIRKFGAPRLVAAAAWLGRFHARATRMAGSEVASFAFRYDAAHFRHWLERALDVAAAQGLALPWLPAVAEAYAAGIVGLASEEPTIVHGEFYPMNILATDREIWPIDWESTGVGPGVIDLASLTLGWPADVGEECIAAYTENRWPAGAPPLRANLATAHFYLCLRMLGDAGSSRHRPERQPFFDYLEQQARTAGFHPGNDG